MNTKLALFLSLVFAGFGQAQLFPSDPLETWAPRISGSSYHLYGVAYGEHLFVAVGDAGTVLTSADGAVWIGRDSGSSNSLYGVAWGNGRFVAVGDVGTILTSTDALSWRARDSGLTVPLLGIVRASGLFVAVGGTNSLTSVDGINWTPGDLGPDAYANAVAYGNNLFVVVGGASPGFHQLVSSLSTSSDGRTWTRQFSGGLESLVSVSYGAGRFVAVGATGDPHCCDHALIRVSDNGMTWSDSYLPIDRANPDLRGVSYGNRTFVVVGDFGQIASSSDGTAWYHRSSPVGGDPFASLSAVTFGFGSFVAVGTGGTILQSGHVAPPTVTSTNDSGPGSLRQAIADANPGDTIKLDLTGTITLTNGELYIDKDLTIIGPAADALAVSGNHAGRVFNVGNFDVTISGLTIRQGCIASSAQPPGEWWGGGVLNRGTLTLTDCKITSNSVTAGDGFPGTMVLPAGPGGHAAGGGIYNVGQLTLTRCEISSNLAKGGIGGSGIGYAQGGQGGYAVGGGIYNAGQLTLARCEIGGNFATGGTGGRGRTYGPGGQGGLAFGGGVANEGASGLSQCSLVGNSARGGCGGGALFGGGLGGDGQGGGIANALDLTLNQCTLFGNFASGGDGGGANSGGSGGTGQGGALAVSAYLTMNLCTISGNAVLISLGGFKGGAFGGAEAGGVFLSDFAEANITHCTIAMNTGGLSSYGSTTVGNCIIASNSVSGLGRDCEGSFTSEDYNLIGHTNGCSILGAIANNLYGQDPLLGLLQDNGGPTWTHALLPGSAAIDSGNSGGVAIDQRGGIRPVLAGVNAPRGDGSDIGAFEVGGYTRLTSVARTNNDIRLQFTTDAGLVYRLERRADLGSNGWTTLPGFLPGTGAVVTFIEANAALKPQGLYRVRLGP